MAYGARASGWLGWIWFAAVMMILVGVFNVITGLSAIFRGALYVQTGDQVVFLNLPAWGWIHLILGILLIAVGIALVTGQTWARVVAVVLVALNAIEHMLFIPAYPWWSLIVIAIDVLVIYALIVHGHEVEKAA
ncbi:hypothetical protein ACFYSC_15155 [Streptosporangium sp. NPDC004379]|uniref:DUF7144 family membrane protein n=1 Tax=Streptosporangium sp. NPDC004379 TaxID=3366189 RepID=UPI0036C7F0F7